jgi:hypothetical protein
MLLYPHSNHGSILHTSEIVGNISQGRQLRLAGKSGQVATCTMISEVRDMPRLVCTWTEKIPENQ